MTARQVITVDFSEINKVETACLKCGAGLILPVSNSAALKIPRHYECLGCGQILWSGENDQRFLGVFAIVKSIAKWQELASKEFKVYFSVDSE